MGTEEILNFINDIGSFDKVLPPFVPFISAVAEPEQVSKQGNKDTKCDLFGGLYTKKA